MYVNCYFQTCVSACNNTMHLARMHASYCTWNVQACLTVWKHLEWVVTLALFERIRRSSHLNPSTSMRDCCFQVAYAYMDAKTASACINKNWWIDDPQLITSGGSLDSKILNTTPLHMWTHVLLLLYVVFLDDKEPNYFIRAHNLSASKARETHRAS